MLGCAQAEIVDETDAYMDNDKTKRVDLHQLMESLPPSMLTTLRAEMLQAAQNFIKHASWTAGPALNPNNARQLTAIRAVAAAAAGVVAPLSPCAAVAASSSQAGRNWVELAPSHDGYGALRASGGGGGVLESPGSHYASMSPASAGGMGMIAGGSPRAASAAVLAPSTHTNAAEAANSKTHWSKAAAPLASACLTGSSCDTHPSGAGLVSRLSGVCCSSDGSPLASDQAAKLRAGSSPASTAPCSVGPAAVAPPLPLGISSAAATGCPSRASAPGVLSRSSVPSKAPNKAFKSTPSPLLSPDTTAAAATLTPSGHQQQQQHQQQQPKQQQQQQPKQERPRD